MGDFLDNMKKLKLFIYYFFLNLILIFMILSIGIINAKYIQDEVDILNYNGKNSNFYDQIDQYQRNYSFDENYSYEKFNIFYKNVDNYQWCAQSFKPNLPVLTKINLLVYKINISCVFIISIRDDLNGNDLVVMSKGSDEISNIENVKWITFDFPDINVLVNKTYYIIAKCYCGCVDYQQDNISYYSWIYGIETQYFTGESWIIKSSNSSEWDNYLIYDFCFETYGCSNRPPNAPKIDGPITGNIDNYYEYIFKTSDPDNDDIYYCVVWGESDSEICMGPFKSGVEAKATFSWHKSGSYSVMVKARDINGAESDWASLEVKMPFSYSYLFLNKYNFLNIANKILFNIIL